MADDDQSVTLELRNEEALVLFEWLSRLDDIDRDEATAFDEAVQRVRSDVVCLLEAQLTAPLAEDYDARLDAAIDDVRDDYWPDRE